MFGNTITLTIDSEPVVLNKVNQDNYSSEYLFRDSVEQYVLRIRHTRSLKAKANENRERHNAELVHTVYATSEHDQLEDKAYFVMDQVQSRPSILLMLSLATWATASAGENLDKLTEWAS